MLLAPLQLANVLAVCLLWGCTNPFLRRGSMDDATKTTTTTTTTTTSTTTCHWFLSLWSKWQFILPFVLNQAGSAFYAVLLGQIDLTLALPLCNSLAFVVTAIVGSLLGEKVESPGLLFLGATFVLSGVYVCVQSQ
jgi:hypothetical protein